MFRESSLGLDPSPLASLCMGSIALGVQGSFSLGDKDEEKRVVESVSTDPQTGLRWLLNLSVLLHAHRYHISAAPFEQNVIEEQCVLGILVQFGM